MDMNNIAICLRIQELEEELKNMSAGQALRGLGFHARPECIHKLHLDCETALGGIFPHPAGGDANEKAAMATKVVIADMRRKWPAMSIWMGQTPDSWIEAAVLACVKHVLNGGRLVNTYDPKENARLVRVEQNRVEPKLTGAKPLQ